MEKKKAYTTSFARIYDDIMEYVPYDFWYNYLNELIKYYNINVKKVLDLACGTGNMSIRFAGDYKKVLGIDISGEMLKIAGQKANNKRKENIKFIQSDLRNFNLSDRVDLAFSVFDSLNYILSLSDLKSVFKNVYKSLKDDGIFVFDLNTINRLRSIKPGTSMFTGDNYTCFWKDIVKPESNKWQVKLKIHFDDNDEYYEEVHEETSYPLNDVRKILLKIGFEYVKIFRAYTFEKGSEKDNRVYFVVLKNSSIINKKNLLTNLKYRFKWKLKKNIFLKYSW